MGSRPNWRQIEHELLKAERVATDLERRVCADAVEAWNLRSTVREDPDPCPSIRLCLVAGYRWLEVLCPGCRMTGYIDLTTLDRHPATLLSALIPALSCRTNCRGHAPFARLRAVHRDKPAMPQRRSTI